MSAKSNSPLTDAACDKTGQCPDMNIECEHTAKVMYDHGAKMERERAELIGALQARVDSHDRISQGRRNPNKVGCICTVCVSNRELLARLKAQ